MTLSQQQFRDQLLDYLYGELSDAQREVFEASLSSSETYRRELANAQATLELARAALAEDEREPPAAVRVAVLEAAAQAASQKPETPRARSFWSAVRDWLQSPPRLAALGALAVVALALLSRQRATLPDAVAPVHAPDAHEHGAPEAPTRADGQDTPERLRDEPSGVSSESEALEIESSSSDSAAEREQPPQPELAPGGGASLQQAPSPGTRARPARPSRTSRPGATRAVEAPQRRAKQPASSGAARQFAVPPQDALGAAQDHAPGSSPAQLGADDDAITDAPARKRSQEAPSRAAPTEQQPRPRTRDSLAPAAAPSSTAAAAPPALEADESSRGVQAEGSPALADEAEVRRAQAHLAAGRLREAIAAFDRLLQRFPRDPRADTWIEQRDSARRALQRQQ